VNPGLLNMSYSVMPALAALLFIITGSVVFFKFNRQAPHIALTILCITTFAWQGAWAILFQVNEPDTADALIKFGYLLIIFLPTSIYHFLVEVSEQYSERKFVYASYALAGILSITLLTSNLFIDGHYQYFFGYYPKAGVMHPVHVIQTVIVTSRGLYLTYLAQKHAKGILKEQLQYCVLSLLIYTFAAVDYLCNYGIEFYPPGIFFILISLGIFSFALYKKELISDLQETLHKEHEIKLNIIKAAAGNLAHELRTPLATIKLDAMAAQKTHQLEQHELIIKTVHRANMSIEMLLNNVCTNLPSTEGHKKHSIKNQIQEALNTYPFKRDSYKIHFDDSNDFDFIGNGMSINFVFFNLINNALYFIEKAMKGSINIRIENSVDKNFVYFRDTGTGIEKDKLHQVFTDFYSTKPCGVGNGLGLGFCKKVMANIGGTITVKSVAEEYTEFLLTFPAIGEKISDRHLSVLPSY